jgi:tetratricopeptide (TPR) repeat protein
MKRWLSVSLLLVLGFSGCSQKQNPSNLKQNYGRPEHLSFLNVLHAQFPSHFSLRALQRLVRLGKINEASNYVNKALAISPQCAALHIAQGFIWEARAFCGEPNALKMAAVAYQAAITSDPRCASAHYLLGKQMFSQGNLPLAQKYFAQAVIIRPNDDKFHYMLACASYRTKDIKTAYCAMKKALALESKNPLYCRTAAIIFAAAGAAKEANQALDHYKKICGTSRKNDIGYVSNRVAYWNNIHANPKVFLMADETTAAPAASEQAAPGPAPEEPKDEDYPGVIFDGYILLVNRDDGQNKGNNVFNAYDDYNKVLNPLAVVLGGSTEAAANPTALVWTGKLTGEGQGSSVKEGTVSGGSFNYNITPVTLNYALNIANSSKSIATYSSRPSLSTLLGKPASIFSGNLIYAAPSGGSTISIDAGDKMDITVKDIAEDGLITLDVSMTSSAPVGQNGSNTLSLSALDKSLSDQLIQVNSSKITTTVRAYPGQTILIGGIKNIVRKTQDSRFPFLGSIPILQYFFSNVDSIEQEVTIAYLLTARLSGGAKHRYQTKNAHQNVFNQLHAADSKTFSFCATPTFVVIMKHLAKSPICSDFQSGDISVFPENHSESLSDRIEQLSNFLYF